MTIDCLVSADLSIEDPDAVAELLVRSLGLPQWRPSWVHDWADRAYRAYFLRPQPDRAIAPTAIEVIGPHPVGGWSPTLRAIHLMQGDRPMKTHNTVFSVPDVEEYVRRLSDASVPFSYDPGSDELPFGKLWVGQSGEGDGFRYAPEFDAGLFIELVPTASLRLPPGAESAWTGPGVEEGAVVRASARSFIVDDLDSTLHTIERTLGWAAPPVAASRLDRCRVATYRPTLPGSASFELLEPMSTEGRVAEHRARYGPGAYRITFAVNGLDAASDALSRRGIGYIEDVDDDSARVRMDPHDMGGLVIDLVDHAAGI